MEHHLGNQLTATAGYSELLLTSPDLPPQLRLYAEKAFQGAHEATETVRRLQQLTRVVQDQSIAGVSILDLTRTEPTPAT